MCIYVPLLYTQPFNRHVGRFVKNAYHGPCLQGALLPTRMIVKRTQAALIKSQTPFQCVLHIGVHRKSMMQTGAVIFFILQMRKLGKRGNIMYWLPWADITRYHKLKQQMFNISPFWSLEVQNQGVSKATFPLRL